MNRQRQPREMNTDINITNLLDTALTLLCGFMIVAPTTKSGIPVELPQVEKSEMISEEEDKSIQLTINVRDPESVEDKIFVDGQRVRLNDLTDMLADRKAENPDVTVTIDADQRAWMDTGVQVLAAANVAGIENFAFSTNPKPATKDEDKD